MDLWQGNSIRLSKSDFKGAYKYLDSPVLLSRLPVKQYFFLQLRISFYRLNRCLLLEEEKKRVPAGRTAWLGCAGMDQPRSDQCPSCPALLRHSDWSSRSSFSGLCSTRPRRCWHWCVTDTEVTLSATAQRDIRASCSSLPSSHTINTGKLSLKDASFTKKRQV